jgi:TetR/AcrR family transcriptional regulator, regulator of mycofactocin system
MTAVSQVRSTARRGAGRPEVTSHAEIEAAAFRLFAVRGFEQTTLEAIADEVGVSRRTLFRYYASKNDIPWGQFDRTLDVFREILADLPDDLPLWEAVHRGVVAFNDFPADSQPPHRDRMRLILTTPALQAHSVLRYGQWRRVIADYVAQRCRIRPDDLLAQTVAQVSLALALTAYDAWLSDEDSDVRDLIDRAMRALRTHLDGS